MVKNTTGGTGTKSLARKNQASGSGRIQLSQDPLEVYGYVSKMFGNGMCEIITNDEKKLTGHIRGKFRGHQKRHNLLTPSSVVLVGLRDWENPIKNCDIMVIYDDNQVEEMKNIPNVQIDKLIQMRLGGGAKKEIIDDNITFGKSSIAEQKLPEEAEMFIIEDDETINMDDI